MNCASGKALAFVIGALVLLSPVKASHGELEELRVSRSTPGNRGGRLVVAQRAEPKTLNPVTALDAPSREVIRLMSADLVSINRSTQLTEPSLATSWRVSRDGRNYTLHLRRGIRFSDGHPFDADDVLFSFQVYLDEKEHSPQRDLLLIGGKPIRVLKLDQYTVAFNLDEPYGAGERMFDSLAILPRHLLEKPFHEGNLRSMWALTSSPNQIAGLGPFRLKEYRPGERVTLERNPYFWEKDAHATRLPYLDQVVFLFAGSEDGQITRFIAGDTDVINRISARNLPALSATENLKACIHDVGPSLEWTFLVFNQSSPDQKDADLAAKQRWFADERFRKAVSLAIDRDSIVRLVYGGRAVPLWGNVTPGNRRWTNAAIPRPGRSTTEARRLLRSAGFWWNSAGVLRDTTGKEVTFSIASSAGNAERAQVATLIQDDLKSLGIRVEAMTLEFRSLVERVLNTRQYEAAIMSLGGGDADPNSEMNVWLSSGGMHIWNPSEPQPATPWEAEIDKLMKQQLIALDFARRKSLYDRVQVLVADHIPVICLASPRVLVAARPSIGNFHPSVLDPYVLWNAAELYRRGARQP